jgi:hypothetical protein
MCASRFKEARPCPLGTAEEPCVCRRFASDFSFFPFFVIAGLDPAIHAAASFAKRFHRRFASTTSAWITGSSPGDDEVWEWRGIARAH